MRKVLILVISSFMLMACGNKEKEGMNEQIVVVQDNYYPLTISDATGKEITIQEEADTIISLMPSNTEIAYRLGLGDKLIAVGDYDNYPEEASMKTKVGGLDLNVELIVSLHPDLVLAHESSINSSMSAIDQIEAAGIIVAVVDDAKSFEEVYETIEFIGSLTNTNSVAEEVVAEMKDGLRSIQEKVKPFTKELNVYAEVSPPPYLYTVGQNTFIQSAFDLLGVNNIFSQQNGWIAIDGEAVVINNPEMIFTMYGYYVENVIEEMKQRSGWQDIDAIKNEQVWDINADLITRSGPRLVEGVEELAKAIYPEAFEKQ